MTVASLVSGVLTALVAGLLLQPIVLRVMTAAAVLDLPSHRSSHTTATPRGGGVAVVTAAIVGVLPAPHAGMMAVPLLLFALIGLAEDLRGVSVSVRLVLQFLAGAVTAMILLPDAGALSVQAAAVVAIAVWLTGYVNVFNFMDGVNGISATHAILSGMVYAILGVQMGLPVLTFAGAVVAAASLTFLPWNAGRARIFLGDVGSYGLGGVLGAVAAYGALRGVPVVAAVAPLAVYLADTGWTLARRIRRGEPWYRAHRTHVYQQLTDRGWSHQRVSMATAIVSAVVCALGLTASLHGPLVRTVLVTVAIGILAAYLATPSWLAGRPQRRQNEDRRIHA